MRHETHPRSEWPTVSVIMPLRNEGFSTLERTLEASPIKRSAGCGQVPPHSETASVQYVTVTKGTSGLPPPDELRAGWKPDPTGAARERFWDGLDWTDQYRTAISETLHLRA